MNKWQVFVGNLGFLEGCHSFGQLFTIRRQVVFQNGFLNGGNKK